jgi:hypothetical protein
MAEPPPHVMKSATVAVLLVLLTTPFAAFAAPTIWARTIERETVPVSGSNPPVVTPPETVSPGRKCTDRLSAADITRNDLITFKVRPEDVTYAECDGVEDQDISQLCEEMLKLGQSVPQPDKQERVSRDDPLADWLAKYATHIIGGLTLVVTAIIGFFTVSHTRQQMREPKVLLAEATAEPAEELPPPPAAPSRPRRQPGQSGKPRTARRSRA